MYFCSFFSAPNLPKKMKCLKIHNKQQKWIEFKKKQLLTAYTLILNHNNIGKANLFQTSSINVMDIVIEREPSRRSHGPRINRNDRVKQRTEFSLKD